MRRFELKLVAAGIAGLATLALAPAVALAGVTYDLTIQKSHTGNFTAGQNGTFTFTVGETAQSANGTGSDTITVSDTLPSQFTFVSYTVGGADWVCNHSGQAVTCTATPDWGPGNSDTFTITVAVASNASGTISNTATISGPGDASTTGNNSSTDRVTINAAASPSPSPSPSASPSPSPTSVTLPKAGGPAQPGPVAWVAIAAAAIMLLGGAVVALRQER